VQECFPPFDNLDVRMAPHRLLVPCHAMPAHHVSYQVLIFKFGKLENIDWEMTLSRRKKWDGPILLTASTQPAAAARESLICAHLGVVILFVMEATLYGVRFLFLQDVI
jgi:hypothetical protein